MSWSATGRVEFHEEGDEDVDVSGLTTSPVEKELGFQPLKQFGEAKDTIQALRHRKILGPGAYSVSMSGHANDEDGTSFSLSLSRTT